MNRARLAIVTALLSLAAIPAAASAEEIAPPGNSGVDQYKETLPAPGGSRPTDVERSVKKKIGAKGSKKLKSYGDDGEAVVELVEETAPGGETVVAVEVETRPNSGRKDGASGSKKKARGGGGGSRFVVADEPTSSALAEIAGQATGASASGGIGWLLPLIIALTVAGAAGYVVGRRRVQS